MKAIECPTWLYGPANEPILLDKGDFHPGEGWTDAPKADPAAEVHDTKAALLDAADGAIDDLKRELEAMAAAAEKTIGELRAEIEAGVDALRAAEAKNGELLGELQTATREAATAKAGWDRAEAKLTEIKAGKGKGKAADPAAEAASE